MRSEFLSLEESRIRVNSRQRNPAQKMRLARVASGKSNSDLKRDPGLLWNNRNRSTGSYHLREFVEKLNNVRFTASEEVFHFELSARVPDVFRDEALTALRAFPEWWEDGLHCPKPLSVSRRSNSLRRTAQRQGGGDALRCGTPAINPDWKGRILHFARKHEKQNTGARRIQNSNSIQCAFRPQGEHL